MPLMQLLLTAVSLSAAAGGAWGGERLLDRYARIPDPGQEEALVETRDEAADEELGEAGPQD